MINHVNQLLAAPTVTDSDRARQVRWLNTYLITFSAATLLIMLFYLAPLGRAQLARAWLIVTLILLVNVATFMLVRKGLVQQGAWGSAIVSLIIVTYTLLLFDGIRSTMVVGYFLILAVVTLFLEGRACFTFLLLNILAATAVYISEQLGLIATSLPAKATIDDLVILIGALCLDMLLLQLLLATIRDSAREARRAAEALAHANQQLLASQAYMHHLHASLEERVARRTAELSRANDELQRQIEERQKTEAALGESQLRFNAIFDHALTFVGILDPDGRLIDINRAPLELIDVRREEVVNRLLWQTPWWEGLPEEQERLKASILQAGEGASVRGETTFLTADGARRIAEHLIHPIRNKEGDIKFLIVEGFDVTERRRAEEALWQAQKTESLGVLAGGVAHDFNNLLVAILGQASLAQALLPPEHSAYSHIEKAAIAARRAADLTRQLLAYSGRGQFEERTLNLNNLIEENLHLFELAIPKHILRRTELAGDLPQIEADSGQMQQVIMNLIINATEAIGQQDGVIKISTGVEEVTETLNSYRCGNHAPLPPGSYVRLEVEDTGSGISADTLGKIFDPFFTTKPDGRGLGLAAVMGIIRGHKGGLQVQSRAGQGTTFRLLFPALPQAAPLPAQESARKESQTSQEVVILVIDDEEPVREAVTDILALEGMEVLAAEDGPTGITLYQQHRDAVNLVILDLSLPGMNGAQIFQRLRQIDPDVKVLLTSGYDQVEATRQFIGHGVAGFLQKPYGIGTLVEKVHTYL